MNKSTLAAAFAVSLALIGSTGCGNEDLASSDPTSGQFQHVQIDNPTVAREIPGVSVHTGGKFEEIFGALPLWFRIPSGNNAAGPGSPVSLTPKQLRTAYGFDQIPNFGKGETIVIVDAWGNPNIAADLAKHCSLYSLPAASYSEIFLGSKASYTTSNASSNTGLEATLDVEAAHAMAPQARILMVWSPDLSYKNLAAALALAQTQTTHQISFSIGFTPEISGGQAAFNPYVNHPGHAFLASSGDRGSTGGVSYPGLCNNCTSVGGTTLILDGANHIASETGWSSSGGGVSVIDAISPQQASNAQVSSVVGSFRGLPDCSMDADPSSGFPVYDTFGFPGVVQVGGTSLSAPLMAGFLATVNAQRTFDGHPPIQDLNAALYSFSQSTFLDITSGNNGFAAQAGWDKVTGLGSPNNGLGGTAPPALWTALRKTSL